MIELLCRRLVPGAQSAGSVRGAPRQSLVHGNRGTQFPGSNQHSNRRTMFRENQGGVLPGVQWGMVGSCRYATRGRSCQSYHDLPQQSLGSPLCQGRPVLTPLGDCLLATIAISPIVRAILAADLDLPADEVIKKAKARGVTQSETTIRHLVYNIRSELKKKAAKPSPASSRLLSTPKPTTSAKPATPAQSPPHPQTDVPPASPPRQQSWQLHRVLRLT